MILHIFLFTDRALRGHASHRLCLRSPQQSASQMSTSPGSACFLAFVLLWRTLFLPFLRCLPLIPFIKSTSNPSWEIILFFKKKKSVNH